MKGIKLTFLEISSELKSSFLTGTMALKSELDGDPEDKETDLVKDVTYKRSDSDECQDDQGSDSDNGPNTKISSKQEYEAPTPIRV